MSSDFYSNYPNANFNNITNRSINFNHIKCDHHQQNLKSNGKLEINLLNQDLEFLNFKLKLKLLNHKISYFNNIISNDYNNDSNNIQYNEDNNQNYFINNNIDEEIEKNVFKKYKREYEIIDNLSEIADNLIDGFNLDKTIQKSNSNNYLISQPILINDELNKNDELINHKIFNQKNNEECINENQNINNDNIIEINTFDLIESMSDENSNNNINKQFEYQPVKNIEYNYISKNDNYNEDEKEEKPNYNCQNNLQETIESTDRNFINLKDEYNNRNHNRNKKIDDKIINDINDSYNFQFENLTFKNLIVDEPEKEKEVNILKEKNKESEKINNNFNNQIINENVEIKKEIEKINVNDKNKKESLNDSDDDDLIISSIMIKAKELANKTKDENLSNKKLINQKINIVHNNNIEKKKKNVSFSDKSLIKISYNQNEKVSELKICDKTNKKANFNLKNMKNYKKILSSNKPKSINYETLSKNSRNRKLTNYNNK